MDSIGQTLRQAREDKGWTLEDVSRATKVKHEILQKLEADRFDELVSPTYTRGFIKLYGDHLGLHGQQLSEGYIASRGGLQRRGLHVETVASTRRKRELSLPVQRVVAVVAGLTILVVVVAVFTRLLSRDAAPDLDAGPTAAVVAPAGNGAGLAVLPVAEFEAFYQPRTKPAPRFLELQPARD